MNVRLRRSGPLPRLALVAALGVLAGAGALAGTRIHVKRLRYELMQLQETSVALRAEVEQLRIEAAALAAPERLEKRARAAGLRYPAPEQIVSLELPGAAKAR